MLFHAVCRFLDNNSTKHCYHNNNKWKGHVDSDKKVLVKHYNITKHYNKTEMKQYYNRACLQKFKEIVKYKTRNLLFIVELTAVKHYYTTKLQQSWRLYNECGVFF